MIEAQHLTRVYDDLRAVDDVSFHIGRGEVVGLLGHNGAGKTTVMKMVTGFLEPTDGTVLIEGVAVESDLRAARARIGYLPENCPVYPEMTVVDYLDYAAALHDMPPAERPAAIRDALARTELTSHALRPIQTLSRGYRQRVGVAQAILHRPDVVILDEPTNGLDPTQVLHMRDLIRSLAEHSTVILSTHVLQEVQAVCERVIIMRAGSKVVDARLDELQRAVSLVVEFAGDAERARQALGSLDGLRVEAAEPGPDGRQRLTIDAGEEAAPAVARALAGAGVELYALHPQRRDLETVFAEVSAGRTPAAVH